MSVRITSISEIEIKIALQKMKKNKTEIYSGQINEMLKIFIKKID